MNIIFLGETRKRVGVRIRTVYAARCPLMIRCSLSSTLSSAKNTPRCQSQGTKLHVCDCHPGVCNKLRTVYAARCPHMIRCSLSSTLSSVKHTPRCQSQDKIARCDCHPGVCNKLRTVYAARYPIMIHCSLSSTLSSVKYILQDVSP